MSPRSASGRIATSSTALIFIQHSAHIPSGREGLFNLVRGLPDTLRYENHVILAEGDYVVAHGRFSGHGRPRSWIAADVVRFEDGKLAEHWDVLQDEATQAESLSRLPMFGDRFPGGSLDRSPPLWRRPMKRSDNTFSSLAWSGPLRPDRGADSSASVDVRLGR